MTSEFYLPFFSITVIQFSVLAIFIYCFTRENTKAFFREKTLARWQKSQVDIA